MVRTEFDSAIRADDTYTYNNLEFKSYFDFWKYNSADVCGCCKHCNELDCDDCEYLHKLTEEECKERNLDPNSKWAGKDGWTCRNTDDFEFCYKYQNSICKECLPFENVEISELYPKFESNGLII